MLTRRVMTAVLALWLSALLVGALHTHGPEARESHGACSICVTVSAPSMAITHADTRTAEPTVAAIVIDVRTLLPDDAFFDRPLARGPPTAS